MDFAYRVVAEHRGPFSALTRIFLPREPLSHALTGSLFLRLLGVVYLIAFISLGSQIIGLIGKNGVAPAGQFMQLAGHQLEGVQRFHLLPTLCWLSASDRFLQFQCAAGAVLALALILGLAPAPVSFCLWMLYLSLASVCDVFLNFQWDALLLETGLLAIFFAPLRLRLRRADAPSAIFLWLIRWLLFRLMFESGVVKLLSGDKTWTQLTALNFHYETQPLPTWIGWYAHQLPGAFQKLSVVIMFILDLVVPFLIVAPGRVRLFACAALVMFQVLITLTGNYCFFNLITVVLCLTWLDDAALLKFVPKKWRARFLPGTSERLSADATSPHLALGKRPASDWEVNREECSPDAQNAHDHPEATARIRCCSGKWPWLLSAPIALVILLISLVELVNMFSRNFWRPSFLEKLIAWEQPFRSVNRYGLFAVMTTSRPEIIVEGSNDGQTWLPYEFKDKPGDLQRRPRFIAPHQPRLDWQMWFAALGDYRGNPWFINFCGRLLQGSPEVLRLLDRNPFSGKPPRYVRAVVYDYHFTNLEARHRTDDWWRREVKGLYCPVLSLPENRQPAPAPGKSN
ncbi:MAG: hypothetical protein DME26_22235 [Verrucomicrobia bacterium]|nr:MAG: hypothetical protein DME26_22235 [Verrucomicrobiota bacterium]